MRAAQLHGVDDLRFVEVPVPVLADGHVLVRTSIASICGSDLHVVCHGAGVAHPVPCPHGYPGHEGVGQVIDSRHPAVVPGERVLCFPNAALAQGFCEIQPLLGSYVLPLPDCEVPAAQLLMAQQLGTVIFAATQQRVDLTGRTALVLGQGSAGLFWTFWLRRLGAGRIIAVDRSDARLTVARAFGADVTINAVDHDIADAVLQLTGTGADYVVEAVGSQATLRQSIELARPGAELMWFGLPDTDGIVPISYAMFFRKKLSACSTYGAQDEPGAASFRTALDLIASGDIDVSPLLSHAYPIEDIATAFAVANDPVATGALKVSVTF